MPRLKAEAVIASKRCISSEAPLEGFIRCVGEAGVRKLSRDSQLPTGTLNPRRDSRLDSMEFTEKHFLSPIEAHQPRTALAPMHGFFNRSLPFMRLIAGYGAPDYFVHRILSDVHSLLSSEKLLHPEIDGYGKHPPDGPYSRMLIGRRSLPDIQKNSGRAEALSGSRGLTCTIWVAPQPKIYKKNVGGGLRSATGSRIDCGRKECLDLLTTVDSTVCSRVKMRIGFDGIAHFQHLLELINRICRSICSACTCRTVKEIVSTATVHYDFRSVGFAGAQPDQSGLKLLVLANGRTLHPAFRKAALDS